MFKFKVKISNFNKSHEGGAEASEENWFLRLFFLPKCSFARVVTSSFKRRQSDKSESPDKTEAIH